MSYKKPHVLVILDGFGYSPQKEHNAIAQAHTPTYNYLLNHYPHAYLCASGQAVGLLPNRIGNSEVGHKTIGAGRVIKEPITIIHEAIKDHSFFSNQLLLDNLTKLKQAHKNLHIMGLMSDAGVHSHIEHLHAYIECAEKVGIKKIYIHAFLDGRDVAPKSCKNYLEQLEQLIKHHNNVSIGSIHGRFYAMDRDHHWDRIEKSYHVLTSAQSTQFDSWKSAIDAFYAQNITDEFTPPTRLNNQAIIKNGDGVIFYNVRPDRARELTQAFVEPQFTHFPAIHLDLSFFITPVLYADKLPTVALYPQQKINHTLKEVISNAGKTQYAIAESEKYAHVTYFFGGRHEQAFTGETQVLIPSLGIQHYEQEPCMSAVGITHSVIRSLQNKPRDFYLINYANADMVGHSGNIDATIKAIECLDDQLKLLYQQIVETMDGTLYITADHGKAEDMYDEKYHQPQTSHTANKVPFIVINKETKNQNCVLPLTQLSDIAPFILQQMHLPIPEEMKKAHV